MKKTILLLLLIIANAICYAQSGVTIRGQVVDSKGESLPGVTISLHGSQTPLHIMSDIEGEFSITDLNESVSYTLNLSFIGFRPAVYGPFKAGREMGAVRIEMKEESRLLNEVVVTGQGTAISKRRLSTDITTIRSEDVDKLPSMRIDQLLQSQLPNAQIRLTGGQAGASSIMRSRGVNSAFINSTPIIYVDGVRMDNLNTKATLGGGSAQGASMSAISDIPAENIERVEYVSGGAATTMFGSDAANGVIQIFTKKGKNGRMDLTFDSQLGLEKGTKDFLHFKRTADLLYQDGFYQDYKLAINGGNEDIGYSISGRFMNTTGSQIHDQNSNRRMDINTGFRAKLGKKVMYESSFTYVNSNYHRNRNGNQGGYTGLWFAESGASSITGPKFNNNLDELTDHEFSEMKEWVSTAEKLQDNKINVNRFITSQTLKYNPFKNFNIKASGGIDYRVSNDKNILTNEYLAHTTNAPSTDKGSITGYQRIYSGYTLDLNAQYRFDSNNLSFLSTLGGQLFSNQDHQIMYSGQNLRDGAKIITTAAIRTADEALLESTNYGVYFLENIGYKDRYYLDLGIRGDGNPAFGKNIGVQFYPKVGLAWVVSSEPWLEKSELISMLKLRANYGLAGNLPQAWANERTINFSGFAGGQAAYFGQPGNDDLKPEKTHTREVAVDMGLFANRLTLTIGYYNTLTKDALFNVPITPSSGEMQSQLRNVGEIVNRGFEVNATVEAVKTKDITLKLTASLNTLHNEVLSSNDVPPFNINGFSSRTIQTVVEQGKPIGFLRGNYGEFDENGVLSNTIPQADLGSTLPTLFGRFGFNFTYRNLDFYANADYQTGAYVNDWDSQFRFNYGAGTEGIPQGEIDKNGRTNWLNFTNMFVKKADFIKVRSIGATYTIKTPLKGVKQMVVGGLVTNPLNFASSDFDPEATISGAAQGQGGATTGGIKYATYSVPRQYIVTLRLAF